MHGLMADGAGGAWTFGGSILTFAFPMILFIVVAGALYVLYTKPESVPGHRAPGLQRSVSYTAMPGEALGHEARGRAVVESARARPAAAGTAGIITGAAAETPAAETSGEAAGVSGEAAGTSGEAAGTEGAE